MKRLSAFVIIFVLLASGIASAADACCADEGGSDSSHMTQSVDNQSNQDADDSSCDCLGCGCAHHGHSKIPFAQVNAENLPVTAAIAHNWNGDIYRSQLHDPISKPPKA